jgi:siderophore synthetase component
MERPVAAGRQDQGLASFTDYLRQQANTSDAAILLDQWGSLEGHPYYPTWKSRPGLTDAEVEQLSPEFNAQVPLRIASLRADNAKSESMPHVTSYHDWFASHFPAQWEQWKARAAKGWMNASGCRCRYTPGTCRPMS